MKTSVKHYSLLLLAFIGLNACEVEKENLAALDNTKNAVAKVEPRDYPLIKTDLETLGDFGEISSVTLKEYIYDNQNRVVSIVKTPQPFTKNDGTIIQAGPSSITSYDYSEAGKVKKSTDGVLQYTYILRPDGLWDNPSLDANGYHQNQYYEYVNGSNGIDKNLVKTTPPFIGYPLNKDYTFGNDVNTIGNKNHGLSFLGKSNYNLPTYKYVEGGGLALIYKYENIVENDPLTGGKRLKEYKFYKSMGGIARPFSKNIYTYVE